MSLYFIFIISSCNPKTKLQKPSENSLEIKDLFSGGRFPNVVVGTDGTVVCSWGRDSLQVRRSENGGLTWSSAIIVSTPGFHGGGMLVNELNSEILLFAEEGHPISPLMMFKSSDQGKSWIKARIHIEPNSLGHIPSLHMNEHGITLMQGKYRGRLIRPSRYYDGGNDRQFWDNHYTNAIFSDDGGLTWKASEPFPIMGTGEAAIVEFSDGKIYYNSRRHKSTDGLNPRRRYEAWSEDGGVTWINSRLINELPDGDQHSDYGLMAGLTKASYKNNEILIFSNIESPEGRHHGTLWGSTDQGKTWPYKQLVFEGSFAYSSLAAGRDGTASEDFIYLLFESGNGAKIARFDVGWLLNK